MSKPASTYRLGYQAGVRAGLNAAIESVEACRTFMEPTTPGEIAQGANQVAAEILEAQNDAINMAVSSIEIVRGPESS